MTTPATRFDRCPTPGCILGRLHTGLCRSKAGSALVAANASPGAYLRAAVDAVGPVTGDDIDRPLCRRERAGHPCPTDPYDYPPGRVKLTSDCGHVRGGMFCAIEHGKIVEREEAARTRALAGGYLHSVDVTVDGEPVPAPDISPGYAAAVDAYFRGDFGPRIVDADTPTPPGAFRLPLPAAPEPEIVPYTPAQQANDLREALETPCTCGQPGGHALNCPRRPLQLHAEIAASIERGEINAPATLGTEVDGMLYYWQGALLGWHVLRTGTLAELFPGGLTLAHRCGTEIALPDVFRLPDLVAAAVAHHRECA